MMMESIIFSTPNRKTLLKSFGINFPRERREERKLWEFYHVKNSHIDFSLALESYSRKTFKESFAS